MPQPYTPPPVPRRPEEFALQNPDNSTILLRRENLRSRGRKQELVERILKKKAFSL